MKKGMLFTIEAMLGLLLVILLLVSIYDNISDSKLPKFSNLYLFDISNDILVLFRHSGEIDKVITTKNPNTLGIFLDYMLPYHICSSIEISDHLGTESYISFKPGCVIRNQNVVSVFGSHIIDEEIYYINIQSWISFK
jgi:hypothetical protein